MLSTISATTWKEILQEILDDINPAENLSYQILVEKLKGKLITRHQNIHKDWEKSGFSVYHQFPFQNEGINNEGTLLHIAAYCGMKGILNIVLEEIKSNANASVENNNTTPEEASLLAQKASINSPDNNGATALHWAAWGGSYIM
ncbi:MAG TPA: hypothetical protein DEQ74_00520, partial [Wolbachia sp.]|nr:hypothetical protein [Wolbachia sp.]